eukprot:TRINITY_DN17705_c2_g1_i2.p1 TRINITY_DN17705_c2_g1~~TRINITY_DN17705_c2_g1_i2.p1  ORF type:complete len:111 (+),score=4.96 TRINITY_DN17705_c2_g1_i2:1-333(+)
MLTSFSLFTIFFFPFANPTKKKKKQNDKKKLKKKKKKTPPAFPRRPNKPPPPQPLCFSCNITIEAGPLCVLITLTCVKKKVQKKQKKKKRKQNTEYALVMLCFTVLGARL